MTDFVSVAALFFLSIPIELFAWRSRTFKKQLYFCRREGGTGGNFWVRVDYSTTQKLTTNWKSPAFPPELLSCIKTGDFLPPFSCLHPALNRCFEYISVYMFWLVSFGRYFKNSWRPSTTERRRQQWYKYPKQVWLKFQFLPSQRKYERANSYVYQRLSDFKSPLGNRVTGYNLFEGSNPLLSARSHKN